MRVYGWVYGRVLQVGYGDWVGTGRGNTGYPATCSRRVLNQRSGPPEALQGLEWGGFRARTPAAPGTTPAGPGRSPLVPSLYLALLPAACRLLANKGEI